MKNGLIRLVAVFTIMCCMMVAGVIPASATVIEGAFGESIDTIDAPMRKQCMAYVDLATKAMLEEARSDTERYEMAYQLEIVQTSILWMPDAPLSEWTEMQQKIYDEYYADKACIVSFIVLDNSMQMDGPLYCEVTGRYGDYAIGKDGVVTQLPLRQIRSRMYASPVLPGMRIINLGTACNQVLRTDLP